MRLATLARPSPAPACTVSDTTARLAVSADRACAIAVRYAPAAGGRTATTVAAALTAATGYTGAVDLTGLSADTVYRYWLVVDGREAREIPPCSFRTFPAAGSSVSFSFAFGSCNARTADKAPGDDLHMVTYLRDLGVRFLVYLGDFIYADDEKASTPAPGQTAPPEAWRFHYRRAVSDRHGYPYTLGTALVRRTLPTFYMWDDHETVNDFTGKNKTDNRYAASSQAWTEFVGRGNPDSMTAGEKYYAFSYGNVGFFVPDGRSFKSSTTATDNSSKVCLGATQIAALKSWLSANNAAYPIKIICSTSTVSGFGTTGADAWGGAYDGLQTPSGTNGYRTERNDLLTWISANAITGVFFISCDSHAAGAYRCDLGGRSFYEVAASPFNQAGGQSAGFTTNATTGPAYFYSSSGRHHGVLTVDTTVADPTLSFQAYGPTGSSGASLAKSFTASLLNAGL